MISSRTRADLLSATASELRQKGYDIVNSPQPSLLPDALQRQRPDAVAIGREPKLVIEIAGDKTSDARRVADLQSALKQVPDWRLYLVLDRASGPPDLEPITDDEIASILERVDAVARIEAGAALSMLWAVLEALGRQRVPQDFLRPQSPGRVVEALAFEGVVTPSEADFLRSMAQSRNAFVHGDFRSKVSPAQIAKFVDLLRVLIVSASDPALQPTDT